MEASTAFYHVHKINMATAIDKQADLFHLHHSNVTCRHDPANPPTKTDQTIFTISIAVWVFFISPSL